MLLQHCVLTSRVASLCRVTTSPQVPLQLLTGRRLVQNLWGSATHSKPDKMDLEWSCDIAASRVRVYSHSTAVSICDVRIPRHSQPGCRWESGALTLFVCACVSQVRSCLGWAVMAAGELIHSSLAQRILGEHRHPSRHKTDEQQRHRGEFEPTQRGMSWMGFFASAPFLFIFKHSENL